MRDEKYSNRDGKLLRRPSPCVVTAATFLLGTFQREDVCATMTSRLDLSFCLFFFLDGT